MTKQRAPQMGYAMTLRQVFTEEKINGLKKELRDEPRISAAFPKGADSAVPFVEALEALENESLGYLADTVEELGRIAGAADSRLGYVALYDRSLSRFERPARNPICVPALRSTVILSGRATFRTGGFHIYGSHFLGHTETATKGDVYMSNDTDLNDLPLSSMSSTLGEHVTIDFLQAPVTAPTLSIVRYHGSITSPL